MYKDKMWVIKDTIEHEISYMGKYGAKGERRAKREKLTPEAMHRQNQRNKENRMRRLIRANFDSDDYWITLKYPAGARPDIKQVMKDLKVFNDRMRYLYARHGEKYKWVRRIEVGKRGGVHIHMIVNRLRAGPTTAIIRDRWTAGAVNYTHLSRDEDYARLAEYIVKEYDEGTQLSMFDSAEMRKLTSYSTSRNLIRPEPVTKEYTRRTVRTMLRDGPKPRQGYIIDKSSVTGGVNRYTGLSWLHYTETKKGTRAAPLWREWGDRE